MKTLVNPRVPNRAFHLAFKMRRCLPANLSGLTTDIEGLPNSGNLRLDHEMRRHFLFSARVPSCRAS